MDWRRAAPASPDAQVLSGRLGAFAIARRRDAMAGTPALAFKSWRILYHMEQGLLSIILHAHLPFVRHPEYPEFLEEDWLFEAISETYIPLLNTFEWLVADGVRPRVTIGLTPPLCEMLVDPLLQERYVRHVSRLIELCENEVSRTAHQPEMNETAIMYRRHFAQALDVFENRYRRNLVSGFRALQDAGAIEIITSG